MLLWHGMAPHAVTVARRPRQAWQAGTAISNEALRFSVQDRVADCAMRREVGRSMRATSWAAEHAQVLERRGGEHEFRLPTEAEADEVICQVEYRVPTGGTTALPERYGKYGGEGEFCAAAEVLRMAVVTMTASQQAEVSDRARVFAATPSGESQRTGDGANMTVEAVLRRCLQRGWDIRAAVFIAEGRHYHAMVPLDAAGKVIYRPLPQNTLREWSDTGQRRLRRWLEAYDGIGGFADGVGAELGEVQEEGGGGGEAS